MTAVSPLADACPSLAHHPGDLPAVQPYDVTPEAGGSMLAFYRCPVCGRPWSQPWTLETSPWPRAVTGPRISTPDELAGDCAELRAQGVTVAEAARRHGVSVRTATRYGQRRGEAA